MVEHSVLRSHFLTDMVGGRGELTIADFGVVSMFMVGHAPFPPPLPPSHTHGQNLVKVCCIGIKCDYYAPTLVAGLVA